LYVELSFSFEFTKLTHFKSSELFYYFEVYSFLLILANFDRHMSLQFESNDAF